MKKITHKYQYPTLIRNDSPNGRTYQPHGIDVHLPSVTTILSATKDDADKKVLENWKKKVGDEEAEKIVNEAIYIGENLHKNLENYMLGNDERSGPLISKIMTDMIIKSGLCHVDEVWGIEASLYYPELYAGTTDLVGIFKGMPCIMDFKNSRKNKKKEWVNDYKLQLAAYAEAHDQLFNTNIKGGVIMMATRDLTYLEFEFVGKEFQDARDEWHRRVDKFYAMKQQ